MEPVEAPAAGVTVGLKMAFSVKKDDRNKGLAPPTSKAFAGEEKDADGKPKRDTPLVIPLTTNKWAKPAAKPMYKPDDDDGDGDEAAVGPAAAVKTEEAEDDEAAAVAAVVAEASQSVKVEKKVSMELTIPMHDQRSSSTPPPPALEAIDGEDLGGDAPASNKAAPLLVACQMPGLDKIENETDKFKYDVSMRAEDVDASSDAYTSVPIDEFGTAMLRGMGWGGYTKDDEERYKKSVEARPGRLGLGATPKPKELYDKRGKLREGRTATNKDADKAMAEAAKAGGKRKWLGAEKVAGPTGGKRPLCAEDVVDILGGDYAARRGRILAPSDEVRPNHAVVQMERSSRKKAVAIPHRHLSLVGDEALRKRPFVDRGDDDRRPGRSGAEGAAAASSSKRKKQRTEDPAAATARAGWLCAGIRVRVAKDGDALFRQKGRVVDVIRSETSGSLRAVLELDSGQLFAEPGMREKFLETALPKDGGRVRAVAGAYRGQRGVLVRRDKKAESAIIRLDEDGDIVTLKMDHVAECLE